MNAKGKQKHRQIEVWYGMVWYGIVEFNVPLDTVHSIGHFGDGDKLRNHITNVNTMMTTNILRSTL